MIILGNKTLDLQARFSQNQRCALSTMMLTKCKIDGSINFLREQQF